MNEILKVDFDTQTVSARELHEQLKIGTRFNDWFPRMTEYGFSEGNDLKKCNGRKMNNLEKAVKELIAENDLTVTQAKGFLRYMRILIEECSCLPKEK